MYTVVRFMGSSESNDELKPIEECVRAMHTVTFDGFDHVPGRFSCDIAEGGDWWSHHEAILKFLKEYSDKLSNDRYEGITVQIDVALDESDWSDRRISSFLMDLELMQELVNAQIDLVFSFYDCGPEPES